MAPKRKEILTLSASPIPPAVAINETVIVEILVSSDTDVVDAPFHLVFDPSVLGFVSATQGEFLGRDGTGVVFIANGQSHPGDVAVGIGRTRRDLGISGAGVIARVQLKAIARGEAVLRLDRAMAWDSSGETVPVSTAGTAVVVR